MKAKIIHVDGSEEDVEFDQSECHQRIEKELDCNALDTVNLRNGYTMYVDDIGLQKEKPVNKKATALYHGICVPGTTQPIVGDVMVIAESEWNDEDE